LHRDGEPQLGDEAGAAIECLERRSAYPEQTDHDDRDSDGHREQVDGVLPPAPQGEVAPLVGRAGHIGGYGGHLPADEHEADGRGRRERKACGVGHERSAHPGETDEDAEQRAAGEPGDGGARQPPSGELAERATEHCPGECCAAQALNGRTHQGAPPVDWCEHDVGDVGGLQRERPALAAAAEAECDGHDHHDAQQWWADAQHIVGLRCGERLVADEIAEPQQRDAAEQCGDVHLVRGVEPLDLAEAVQFALGAQGAQRSVTGAGLSHRGQPVGSGRPTSPTSWPRRGAVE
jgi:hypothetical protein